MHHNLEISTRDPSKCKMDFPKLIESICLGIFIRMKRVSIFSFYFQIAIYGKNFCMSAKDAFMLIMRNVVR